MHIQIYHISKSYSKLYKQKKKLYYVIQYIKIIYILCINISL